MCISVDKSVDKVDKLINLLTHKLKKTQYIVYFGIFSTQKHKRGVD